MSLSKVCTYYQININWLFILETIGHFVIILNILICEAPAFLSLRTLLSQGHSTMLLRNKFVLFYFNFFDTGNGSSFRTPGPIGWSQCCLHPYSILIIEVKDLSVVTYGPLDYLVPMTALQIVEYSIYGWSLGPHK